MPTLLAAWNDIVVPFVGDWKSSKGPCHAAALEMRRLDWQALRDFTMHVQGGILDLLKITPARVRQLAVDALQNGRLRAIASRLGGQSMPHPVSPECVPATGRLAGIARALFTGAVRTHDRWVIFGYIMDPNCPVCSEAGDTILHLLWYCSSARVARAKYATA